MDYQPRYHVGCGPFIHGRGRRNVSGLVGIIGGEIWAGSDSTMATVSWELSYYLGRQIAGAIEMVNSVVSITY
jgi:hypothetical protein